MSAKDAAAQPPLEGEIPLTVRELCERLTLSPAKLHRLCAKGLPYIDLSRAAGDRRFFWSQVNRWLQQRVKTGVPVHPSTSRRRAIKHRRQGFGKPSGDQQGQRGSRAAVG